MAMDPSIALQKQIRDNSSDLQKEFLDMEAWEEQMKKKDLEIRSMKDDQVLPPVRTKRTNKKKKSSPIPELSNDEKPSKTQRISGSDYKSWDKFDVNKACEELEGNFNANVKEEKEYEIPSKEELEKEHSEAVKLKEEGNALVQKKEYAKAVGKYSAAIKIFPGDATFYANRALCHLKINNLYSAESDCTAAIKLDERYVKAYHRRASARIEMKEYKNAIVDLEKILKIEPSNKEATCLLNEVQKKVQKVSQPIVISGNEKGEKSSIEKQIGAKLFGNTSKPEQNKIQEQPKQSEIKNIEEEQPQPSTSKDEKSVVKEVTKKKESNTAKKLEQNIKLAQTIKKESHEESNSVKESKKQETIKNQLPSWLPKLKEGVSIIEPLTEPSRRLSQTLKRISIQEISENESIFKDIEISTRTSEKPPTPVTKPEINFKSGDSDTSYMKSTNVECRDKINTEVIENLPPAPKSAVTFLITWRKNTSLNFRHKYLKQIAPEDFPSIFKESLESSIFSEILSILKTKFIPNEDKIYNYLKYLAKVKRFRALVLFMTQTDKEVLKHLFEYCKTNEGKGNEEMQELFSTYEM